ncbi:MerR family DNA-binding transcriptional regulator [Pelagibius sp. Alg239-R121]|uniref:MerR family transcriptional regulator n=1 Tax=Pelagibius sp. Alg239-R121 TaxID=2993448 RepID=UPI0024A6E4DA|nr:MerR family DNA-binding transcriptional regulator [Pelagibius sp. Alg239-R121]
MTKLLTVTELARELGVTARAIRFYEDKGLISPQRVGNRRVYSNRDRGRLVLILRGKRLGFSLREIREWLELYDAGSDQLEQMKRLLALTQDRLATLESQYDDLEATIEELREIEAEVLEHLKANKGAIGTAADADSPNDPLRPRRKRK